MFIKKYLFKSEEDDKKFIRCFWRGITEECEEMFELRMLLYGQYPDLAQELFIDVKSVMEQCEMRAIKLISFWMKHKIRSQGKYVYRYEEELFGAEDSFLIENGEFVLTELLPYIPKNDSVKVKYNEWSGKYWHMRGIERACVELVKNVLRVHGKQCEKEQLLWLENVIYKYISPRAVEWYQRRIEWNKSKQSEHVYWSFWGDLQYELLSCLPEERISKKSKDLLQVLSRRFHKVQPRYYNMEGHSGWVKSPVSGKKYWKKVMASNNN